MLGDTGKVLPEQCLLEDLPVMLQQTLDLVKFILLLLIYIYMDMASDVEWTTNLATAKFV